MVSTRFERITLGPNDDGRRLDRIVRKALPRVPLSRIYRALRSREIRLNGSRARADTRVHEGDLLEVAATVRDAAIREDTSAGRAPRAGGAASGGTQPAAARPEVVLETDHLLVVVKDAGELTHGEDSLETRVRDYLRARLAPGVSFRPGPVHRLDRNTSGLVVFAASLRGAREASRALKEGALLKRYVALLEGDLRPAPGTRRTGTEQASGEESGHELVWRDSLQRNRSERTTRRARHSDAGKRSGADQPPRGKEAVSRVEPVAWTGELTLALVRIETGRTHQIRAQCELHGHPLAGDRKYGATSRGPYLLHAGSLTATPDAGELGFHHLWMPPPERFEQRIAHEFGLAAVDRLRERLASPPR